MEHPLHVAPTDFLRSPLGIAVLMLVSSVGGGWLKDRLSTESRDNGSVVRIDALNQRLTDHLSDAVSRRQFDDVNAATPKRLDDVRQDIRDLKLDIDNRFRPSAVARP
ncbi:MAG: hypothetical protein M3N13_02880 [Candidatus Eremiobacteraeota bacterium]|nr:hypothetical protein [Candidatus Eremiobacteraeota bacterium]